VSEKKRYEFIDIIRGFTVLLMIIFHFCYDLNFFHFIKVSFNHDIFWWSFPRVIVFIFLIAMGMSLALVHHNGIKWDNFVKRQRSLILFAVIISIVTYFAFRSMWIYFGTLHCIAVSSLLALPLVSRPKISMIITIVIITPLFFGFTWPFFKLDHYSMDYIPLLPWFGIVTLGMALFHLGLHKLQLPTFPFKKLLIWLGKNSLNVYLVHQAILFPIVYAASLLR
jgi:uncharacterized membrane protein